jgi:hypothetical protein
MCYDDGQLTQFLDGECSPEERAEIEEHVRSCGTCGSAAERLRADALAVAPALELLMAASAESGAESVSENAVALPMPQKSGRLNPGAVRVAAAVAVLLLAGSFAFAPVRSMAANALRIFRVSKVQTISLSAQDVEQIGAELQKGSGHISLKDLGDVWIDGGGSQAKVVTLAQAQKAVDFPVKLPTGMKGEPTLMLQPAQTYKFKLNVTKLNQLLDNYGSDRKFSQDLDGKVFEIKIPAVLMADYAGAAVAKTNPAPGSDDVEPAVATGHVVVGQARSPEIVVPDGVDVLALRDVLVNLPFLPENVRRQLGSVSDWQNTLLVPSLGGSSKDIDLDGVPAVVMLPPQQGPAALEKNGSETANVIWNQDGVIRAVGGDLTEDTAVRMAKSMLR